jgi:nicotinate-nucleotide--dimethylbenzimidazole phosphoribosyltransferase
MPDISPELAARIESLRASHAENPARFFMPLASAYREAGDVARAEELLRENLKRHPGYLSAHVLLGRCLADRGATAEARNEFQYVLSVDQQNLIALRSLGDMAAAEGDRDDARKWYGELLSVDPMNAEARNALATLDAEPEAAPAQVEGGEAGGFGMVEPDEAAAHDDHPAAHADPGSWGEVSLDTTPASAAVGDEPAAAEPSSFDALDFGSVDLAEGAGTSPEEPAAAQQEESVSPASQGEPAAAPQEEPAAAAPESAPADAWGAIDDGQDGVDAGAVEPLELEEFYGGPAGVPAAHGDEHDEHGEPEEVVTETIAELYARQGFPDRAAGVYRELIARRGEEPALVRRLQELEAQLSTAEPAGDATAEQPAPPDAEETPDWLHTVDSVVSGETSAAAAAPADAGFDTVDFGPADAEAQPAPAEAAAPAPSATTGDDFADSFAGGFDGAVIETDRAAWETPRVEESAPVAELEPPAEAAEPSQPAAPAAAPGGGQTIAAYLSALLSWRPAPPAAPGEAQSDLTAPPPARPWDEQTLGASDQQPPVDEPWIAAGPAATEEPASAEPATEAEPESWADAEPEPTVAEPEPWAAEPEPWADAGTETADAGAAADVDEDLPWMSSAVEPEATEAQPPASAPASEPMPWETSFDLSPEVPEDAAAERPAPRQEPTVEPAGGFSFEDFFSEPVIPPTPAPPAEAPEPEAPAPPAAAAQPAASPAPPAAPSAAPAAEQAQQGGEEDEDLESFQAWLQSLKR